MKDMHRNPEITLLYLFHAQKALFEGPKSAIYFFGLKMIHPPPPLEVLQKIIRSSTCRLILAVLSTYLLFCCVLGKFRIFWPKRKLQSATVPFSHTSVPSGNAQKYFATLAANCVTWN